MRIAVFNTNYHPENSGGAERSVKTIVDGLKDEHDVTVVCSNKTNTSTREVVDGVRVYRIPALNLGYSDKRTKSALGKILWYGLEAYNPAKDLLLARVFRELEPDVVHTHNLACLSTSVWRTAKSRGVPVVHTLRDQFLLCRFHMHRRGVCCRRRCVISRVHGYRHRRNSRRVDVVVGISNFILGRHLDHGYFPNSERLVICNGVEVARPARSRELGGQPRFGYLGSLMHGKGIELLLQTFWQGFPGSSLHIGGDGDPAYVAHLRQSFTSPRIVFHGPVDAGAFLGKCDVLIVPSLVEEAFGRVIVEAFQMGVPVIGSTRGAIPELVDEGRTGWLFSPEKPHDLRRVVRRVLERPRQVAEMSEDCRAEGLRYSVGPMVSSYKQLFRRLTRTSGRIEMSASGTKHRPICAGRIASRQAAPRVSGDV